MCYTPHPQNKFYRLCKGYVNFQMESLVKYKNGLFYSPVQPEECLKLCIQMADCVAFSTQRGVSKPMSKTFLYI